MFEITYRIDLVDNALFELVYAEYKGVEWVMYGEEYCATDLCHRDKYHATVSRSILVHDEIAAKALFDGLSKKMKRE